MDRLKVKCNSEDFAALFARASVMSRMVMQNKDNTNLQKHTALGKQFFDSLMQLGHPDVISG